MFHFPIAHRCHVVILEWHDANSDLRGLAQVWTVERNRRYRPAPHAFPGFLAQALQGSIFHYHFACSLRRSGVSAVTPKHPAADRRRDLEPRCRADLTREYFASIAQVRGG